MAALPSGSFLVGGLIQGPLFEDPPTSQAWLAGYAPEDRRCWELTLDRPELDPELILATQPGLGGAVWATGSRRLADRRTVPWIVRLDPIP